MPATDIALAEPASDLELIAAAAAEAGRIAMRYFGNAPEVWMKPGESPVTEADFAVDTFLRETLTSARPGYGWLSEETVDSAERLSARRTFVVDPIDGTRAFVEGRNVWCVSVAVVETGRPLAGVLDCPALGEVYLAAAGGGATRNGEAIAVRSPTDGVMVAGPRPLTDALRNHYPGLQRRHPYIPSLAYRIAMLADGRVDGTFVKPDSHDWDLAAADLILAESGGRVLDPRGHELVYAGIDPVHGVLAAGSGALLEAMVEAISGHAG
ncbi:MAG: 3'(2'),5'-bisphosphate nucleotidase CysQ [Rhizobiaceae bacterium]|nr:3'(2'),5'-bisphosphate nucleotidase CysQ [Rhizobiaceae bacterium]